MWMICDRFVVKTSLNIQISKLLLFQFCQLFDVKDSNNSCGSFFRVAAVAGWIKGKLEVPASRHYAYKGTSVLCCAMDRLSALASLRFDSMELCKVQAPSNWGLPSPSTRGSSHFKSWPPPFSCRRLSIKNINKLHSFESQTHDEARYTIKLHISVNWEPIMSTRKRKAEDEELVALPSDESEEEEEWVLSHLSFQFNPVIIQTANEATTKLHSSSELEKKPNLILFHHVWFSHSLVTS